MNESVVRKTLKNLILTNEDKLVTELYFQGNPRTIHQVTTSTLTPPTGYYFISITTTSIATNNRPKFGNTSGMAPSEAKYEVMIEIADYVIGTTTEDELFEKMDGDFQLFTDRLVSLLRETRWIEDLESKSMFRLNNERSMIKNNVGSGWEEASQYHAMLYSRITFQLLEECTDDSKLYSVE